LDDEVGLEDRLEESVDTAVVRAHQNVTDARRDGHPQKVPSARAGVGRSFADRSRGGL